MNLVGMDREA